MRTQVRVRADRSRVWAVEVDGDPGSHRRFHELHSARRYAREVAVERTPSEVHVVETDGSLLARSVYAA